MTEKEKLLKKRRAAAAKLTNPKPVELPSGAFRCQKIVNGQRLSAVDEDPVQAHAKVNAMAAGLIARKNGAVPRLTFEQALDGYLLANDNVFSPATIAGYRRIKKNHLSDICPLYLADMTQDTVQLKVNALARQYSAKTVRNVYGLITAVYYRYFPDRKLAVNLPQKDHVEIQIPTEDEIRKIVLAAEGSKYELPILLAMWLGLRASEIRGLTWDCVDGDYLRINKAIVEGEDGPALKKPKSTSGTRVLKIPQRIAALIDQQPRVDEYIVHHSGQALYKGFSRVCEKAGVRHYRFHDLRHVFASVSIALGTPMEYIRKDMGHKSDNMLKSVYGHMMESKRAEYSDAREAYYEKITHEPHTENPESIEK